MTFGTVRFHIAAIFVGATALSACSRPAPKPAADSEKIQSGPAILDPSAYAPYTRLNYPHEFRKWGLKGVERLNRLRKAAAETVVRNPRCVGTVDSVEVDEVRSKLDHPVVWVSCINGGPPEIFYLSEENVGGPTFSETQRGKMFTSQSGTELCLAEVKRKLAYPSSISIDILSSTADQAPTTGNWGVNFNFKAINALGARLPKAAHCVITTDGQVEADVANR